VLSPPRHRPALRTPERASSLSPPALVRPGLRTPGSTPSTSLLTPPPLPPLSLPPRQQPCRRLLLTVMPASRALRLRASSSSSPLPAEKRSTARVSRPAVLSTVRTGQLHHCPTVCHGSSSSPWANLPAHPALPPPHNSIHVCLADIICFRHALTLQHISSRLKTDADNAAEQKADSDTTESLDWHKPHHTAADKLPQPCQWLRQISTKVFGSPTAQGQRGPVC
jgi:hypothetical protein